MPARNISAPQPDSDAIAPAPWQAPRPLPSSFCSERLVLRFWREDDAARLFEAVNVARESHLPWLPWVRTDNRTVDECRTSIEKFRVKAEPGESGVGDYVIGIFDRRTGQALGGTGLHRIVATAHEGEIGYWVRGDRRCEGICTEAVRAIITWAFTRQDEGGWGLRRLHIRCGARNLPSQRVPRKIGIREEARLVQERFIETLGWEDTLVFGVLREEWDIAARELRRVPSH